MNNHPPGANKGAPGATGLSGNGQDARYVNDLKSTNSKQLLNAYVYDFLIKSSLPQTAQSFIKEADIPTGAPSPKAIKRPPQKELLPLAISLDAPQGFLYEWWQIFWDVFNARTHRGGSENAQQYYQMQLLRQHKEHALHNSTFHAAQAQAAAAAAAGLQPQQQQYLLQQQYQQHQQMMARQQQQPHSPHPNQHPAQGQSQHPQTHPSSQQPHPNTGAGQPHPGNGMSSVGAPTPQSHQTPQQAIPGHPPMGNGAPATGGTPVSAGNGNTPMSHQPQISLQQQFPAQYGQFQQPMDAAGAAAMGAYNPMVQQPDGSFIMGPHQALQPSQQQQEVQQHFQQQQNQLFAGQKRGNVPVAMASGLPQNYARIQQTQAQFQMNQLRQQQFVQMQQSQHFKAPMGAGANGRPQYGPQQAPTPGSNGPQRVVSSPNKKQKLEELSNKNSPLSGSPHNGKESNHPSPLTQPKASGANSANMPSPLVNQTEKDAPSGGSSALHDYQMQLLLLERENKKMLNVSKKDATPADAKKEKGKKMLPPKSTKGSTPTTSGSPAVNSVGGTLPATNGRKKSVAQRRKTKKTAGANNKSEPPTPTTPLTPNPAGSSSNNPSSSSALKKKPSNAAATIPPHKLTKDEKDTPSNTSQLTPPNSENAINSNGEIMLGNTDDVKNEPTPFPDDEISGGQAMHGVQPMGQDMYNDFALSDFSNDISGDGNFNLETFLNTDGGDMAFDSYWRDSVEATE